MDIKQFLKARKVASYADLESQFGDRVADRIDSLVDIGEVVKTAKGNYISKEYLVKGMRALLPYGVIGRVEAVVRSGVKVAPEVYPFGDTNSGFTSIICKFADLRVLVADDDLSLPGKFVVTLPGYPSLKVEAKTALRALIEGISKLMETSSNKKIVFHDEWYGEPQFGTLVNRLRNNLDRYVIPAPPGKERQEPTEPKSGPTDTEVPPSPAEQLEEGEDRVEGIFETTDPEALHQDIAEEVANKIVQKIIGASFVDWVAKHYAMSDICRNLSITLKEAAKSVNKDTIKESDKKKLISNYVMALSDKLGDEYDRDLSITQKSDLSRLSSMELARFIVRQDQVRGIRPYGSTFDRMAALWERCASAARRPVESYAWRVARSNSNRFGSVESPLMFTLWLREASKTSYERTVALGQVLSQDEVEAGNAARVAIAVFGDMAEGAVEVSEKLSSPAKRAILDEIKQLRLYKE